MNPSARPVLGRPGSSASSSAPKAGASPTNPTGPPDQRGDNGEDQDDDEDDEPGRSGCGRPGGGRTARPAPADDRSPRTVGQVFTAAGSGKQYRPSMFSPHPALLRRVLANGAPRIPAHYDYRRAALDALHFSKLCGRLWANLRRCAGYNVQYFSAIEAQRRLAPHLHAATGAPSRGDPATGGRGHRYACGGRRSTRPLYVDRLPVDRARARLRRPRHRRIAADLAAGARPARRRPRRQAGPCPAIREAARPARRHPRARRPGRPLPRQVPHQGDRRDPPRRDRPGLRRHVDRLHAELRWLPCSPRCANWLRYGVQPDHARPA